MQRIPRHRLLSALLTFVSLIVVTMLPGSASPTPPRRPRPVLTEKRAVPTANWSSPRQNRCRPAKCSPGSCGRHD